MKSVLIHYFTGTGNTYHAVKLLGDTLGKSTCNIEYSNMESTQCSNLDAYDLHIFAFPVYGFGMPAIAKKYIKALPSIEAGSACILSIGGQTGHSTGVLDNAFEGDALKTASKMLRKRGFKIQITELLGYPENWTQFFNPPNEETQTKINVSQDLLVAEIAEKILSDTVSLRTPPTLPYLLGKVVNWAYASIGRRLLGKVFIADEKCNGCGKCIRLCPVHNIEMRKNSPVWKWRCEGCQRCINVCSSKSVQTSTVRLITILAMQLAPIYFVTAFNKKLPVNFIFDIILYALLAFILTAAADYAIERLGRLPWTSRLMKLNFTDRYRRYLSKDFHF